MPSRPRTRFFPGWQPRVAHSCFFLACCFLNLPLKAGLGGFAPLAPQGLREIPTPETPFKTSSPESAQNQPTRNFRLTTREPSPKGQRRLIISTEATLRNRETTPNNAPAGHPTISFRGEARESPKMPCDDHGPVDVIEARLSDHLGGCDFQGGASENRPGAVSRNAVIAPALSAGAHPKDKNRPLREAGEVRQNAGRVPIP